MKMRLKMAGWMDDKNMMNNNNNSIKGFSFTFTVALVPLLPIDQTDGDD